MAEPHHVGSIFGSFSLTGCLPTNLVTHSSGRLHMCFPLNCCQTQKSHQLVTKHTTRHIHRESLLKVGYTCRMWITMAPLCTLRKLFAPSRVRTPHQSIKLRITFRDGLLPRGTNPYVGLGCLVPDVVPFDLGKDINCPRVMSATTAYVIHLCERPFYEWTNEDFAEPSKECSLLC